MLCAGLDHTRISHTVAIMAKARAVVLVSGDGSNLSAILAAVADQTLNLDVVLVLSNRSNAYALTRASQAGVPTEILKLKSFKDAGKSRDDYDLALAEKIASHRPDVIVLAGWMHILSAVFLKNFGDIIINLHPALPNQFDGTNAIERAYAAFEEGRITETGVMVHMVTENVDQGRILVTETVEIRKTDTLQGMVVNYIPEELISLVVT